MSLDLLTLVESGGCSTKLSAAQLAEALQGLPKIEHERLLVDIETHDDAGVYRLSDDIALIQTTDFFSPICSDPYEFGQIAAANALSDVYAMGGQAITALNLVMFPPDLDLKVLRQILAGGQSKAKEAGCLIVGGHTISDSPPKYGLAVTGIVHPDKIITNANAKPGEKLILTKPLGVGILTAAKKQGEVKHKYYQEALENMKLLNKEAVRVMQDFGIRCATDITGFGLLGHGFKLAQASKVSLRINVQQLPKLDQVYELVRAGLETCPIRRNRAFVGDRVAIAGGVDPILFNLSCDAQTSGGLLMTVPTDAAEAVVAKLKAVGYPQTCQIGEVLAPQEKTIYLA